MPIPVLSCDEALGAGLVAEIGSRQGSNMYLQGDIAEIITFNTNLGAAQRSIVENYLSAKYDVSLTTGNRYTGDDAIKGNYDRDVFGVGSLGGSDVQINSGVAGFGIEVVAGGSAEQLNSGEFVLAGHKVVTNSVLTAQNIDGKTGDRWERVWYVDNNGGAADATLGFNFDEAGLTGLFDAGTTYSLIYSSDVTLASWDILPYTASLQPGDVITFNLPAGMLESGYYTLAFNFLPVPEPSSLGLLACGTLLVLRRRRRSSK